MRRSFVKPFALGIAALVAFGPFAEGVQAQESEQRVVVAPRGQTFSVFGGSGGYLGIGIADVNDDRAEEAGMSEPYGVYVSEVVDEGPAADAGLEEGDVITRWNGERLESVAQLERLARETPPGRRVELSVFRDGGQRDMSVELGDRAEANVFAMPSGNLQFRTAPRGQVSPSPRTRIAPNSMMRVRPGGEGNSFIFSRRARLGASIQSLGDQLADYFGVDGGVLVTAVNEDSPAEAAGLRAGDVIVELAGESVEEPGDLLELLSDQEAGSVTLRVIRDGSATNLTVELEEPDEENQWEEGNGVSFYWDEGDNVQIEPFSMEGIEVGPVGFDGWESEPFEWQFDMGEYFEGEGENFEIRIPRMEIPAFEMPMIEIPNIEIPGFEMRVPRIVIQV